MQDVSEDRLLFGHTVVLESSIRRYATFAWTLCVLLQTTSATVSGQQRHPEGWE